VLTSLIDGFETRFGDGSNVCEVDCEDPSRQPRGYTKVSQYTQLNFFFRWRAILFSLACVHAILSSLLLFCPVCHTFYKDYTL